MSMIFSLTRRNVNLSNIGESDDVPLYFNGTLIEYERHGVHLGHSTGPITHCYMVRDVARDCRSPRENSAAH